MNVAVRRTTVSAASIQQAFIAVFPGIYCQASQGEQRSETEVNLSME